MQEIYHSGEREVQRLTGEELIANSTGRVITDTIINGAINFIEKQPMAVVSSSSATGQVWTSLLVGDFGFTKVPDPNTLLLDSQKIHSDHSDIFFQNIQENPEIGALFIELATRRRFRINGTGIRRGSILEINIQEAYPNCPKYIQKRVISFPDHFKEAISKTTQGTHFGDSEKHWIMQADTFFVGSRNAEGKMDASHRGGNPGFIEVQDDDTLKIPDYHGNSMYNTLGNFVHNPNAGLLFIDFEKRETLQLAGKAELLFGQKSSEDIRKTSGTGRYWLFKSEYWIRTVNHHDVNWDLPDFSPFNP